MRSDQPDSAPPSRPEPTTPGGVGIDSRGDVSVGGDVAGRDVVKTTKTVVGFGPREVQRLLITVGALVFVTAACFFSGGVVVGGAAIAALNAQVASSLEAARSLQAKLDQVQSLPPGQPFNLTFTEEEISSYVRFVAGNRMGLVPQTGKVRLLEAGRLIMAGRVSALGDLPVAATFELQYDVPGKPLRLTAAMVQVVQLRNSSFGWVWIPPALLQPFADDVNEAIGAGYALKSVRDDSTPAERVWTVSGVTH